MQVYRHKRRGTKYVEVVTAELSCSDARLLVDGAKMSVYLDISSGKLWVRAYDEFHQEDRFEKVDETQDH